VAPLGLVLDGDPILQYAVRQDVLEITELQPARGVSRSSWTLDTKRTKVDTASRSWFHSRLGRP
jgi:hypothetical protein